MYFFLDQKFLLLRLNCLCKVEFDSILPQNLHNILPTQFEIGIVALILTGYLDFVNRNLLEYLREKQYFSATVVIHSA